MLCNVAASLNDDNKQNYLLAYLLKVLKRGQSKPSLLQNVLNRTSFSSRKLSYMAPRWTIV